MNPESFLENFSLLANTPNAIQKLREMILQMAVQGKLVPQNPDDEPAEVLLERIRAEKERLIKEKKIKNQNDLEILDNAAVPYVVPKNWKWAYLGQISQIVGGGTPKTNHSEYFSDNEISWLTPADLYSLKSKYIGKGRRDITEMGLKNSSAQLMPAGTVLFSSRAPIGYVAIASNDLATNQGFKSCIPYIMELNEYIYYFLKSAVQEIENNASGTTFKEVSGKIVSQILFPLPPLAEQKRIVAKVDQLMELCDQLESLQKNKNESCIHLNNAALNKLLDASSPEDFERHWRLVCDNFGLLYDNLENVEKLKQIILQLAVMGKLVPQDAEDEPAEVLLERIRAEKERLVEEGKIKKSKNLPPIEENEISHVIPKNWIWVKLGEVVDYNGVQKVQAEDIPEDAWLLDLADIEKDTSNIIQRASFKDRKSKSIKAHFKVGDILYGKLRPYLNKVVVADEEGYCTTEIVPIRTYYGIDSQYLMYVLKRPDFLAYVNSKTYGVKMPRLGTDDAVNALFPLPSLAEQKRIVAKVDQLMELCDKLENGIRQAQEDGEKLVEVAVNGLLASCD